MNPSINLHSITRRRFGLACGAGIYAFAVPITGNAAAKKVPMATGIDALFAPFVVAAERTMFEKSAQAVQTLVDACRKIAPDLGK